MSSRNPSKDQIAVVGIGTTPYSRESRKSVGALTLEACTTAIGDAGLVAAEIDGVIGSTSTIDAHTVQAALGIPEITWWANVQVPFTTIIIEAANAIFAGVCNIVLAYHGTYRTTGTSASAARDPFRRRYGPGLNRFDPNPDRMTRPVAHGAWANRYLEEFNVSRRHLGYVAINNRSHAAHNPNAALRTPLGMDEYLAAPVLRFPLSRFDMDYPVDAGEAFVITTVERAADLPNRPVLLHAASQGVVAESWVDQIRDLNYTGQDVVMKNLWARSDLKLKDIDIFYPYDGFSIIVLKWLEAVGYCGLGEAGQFIESNWNSDLHRIEIEGRILVNTHGGGLSEGGVQGANHVREAVVQLRGDAGDRQVEQATAALVTPGTFFHNAGGMILRT